MILGQSAATAAALAIDGGTSVQAVPYERLRERLLADGQVLEYATKRQTSRFWSAGTTSASAHRYWSGIKAVASAPLASCPP